MCCASFKIKAVLEAIPDVGDVTIQYITTPLPQDKLGKLCPSRQFYVTFETARGDLELLQMNAAGLTGSGLAATVTEVRDNSKWCTQFCIHLDYSQYIILYHDHHVKRECRHIIIRDGISIRSCDIHIQKCVLALFRAVVLHLVCT